jgi:spore germination cell wall hydrolase CwlJ-like protein
MTKKTSDVHLRSDRVLVVALAVILAAASAAVGAAANNHPHADQVASASVALASGTAVAKAVAPAPALRGTVTDIAAKQAIVSVTAKPANSADMAMAQLLAEHRCLSEVMYYEARGEGTEGQMAVAEVVFHRLRRGHYGHSICGVVYEGADTTSCQFSFACHGAMAERKSPVAWHNTEILAARILAGQVALRDITGDATHFHAISVTPDWADNMERTVQIGNHVFYKRARSRAL